MCRDLVVTVLIGLILGLVWPHFFTNKSQHELQKESVDELQNIKVNYEKEIVKLQKQLADKNQEINKLQNTIKSLKADVAELQNIKANFKKEVERLQKELAEKNQEIKLYDKIEAIKANYESKIEKLEDKIKQLQDHGKKESSICQQRLEDCNYRCHVSQENSKSQLIYVGLFVIIVIALFCYCTPGGHRRPRPFLESIDQPKQLK